MEICKERNNQAVSYLEVTIAENKGQNNNRIIEV